ncbi:MAG: peptide chain release factor N(5)-glutamine methyltransferase [Planctomycetota bacterium]
MTAKNDSKCSDADAGNETGAELLAEGFALLRNAGGAERRRDARLDVELLLAHAIGVPRAVLERQARVASKTATHYRTLLARRARGEPIAYLLGEWEFYGISFAVSPAVLVPRPETELLVDWALEHLRNRAETVRIADLGTGSGCIAIAIALELSRAEVHATDISEDALAVARQNVARHGLGARVRLYQGDWLAPLTPPFDLIVSNPPYVARNDSKLSADVARFEPAGALHDSDGDGLGAYRRLANDVGRYLSHAGAGVLVEVGEDQAPQVTRIFAAAGFRTTVRRDLAGIERALLCQRVGVGIDAG